MPRTFADAYDRLRARLRRPSPDRDWTYAQRLEALRFYLDPQVKVLRSDRHPKEGPGTTKALLELDGTYFVWRDGFGSCDGCDAFARSDAFDYLRATFTAGANLRAFSERDRAEAE